MVSSVFCGFIAYLVRATHRYFEVRPLLKRWSANKQLLKLLSTAMIKANLISITAVHVYDSFYIQSLKKLVKLPFFFRTLFSSFSSIFIKFRIKEKRPFNFRWKIRYFTFHAKMWKFYCFRCHRDKLFTMLISILEFSLVLMEKKISKLLGQQSYKLCIVT